MAIGTVSLDMARIVRGQTLSLKRKEFIEAAQVGGVSTSALLFATLCRMYRCGGGLRITSGAQHDPSLNLSLASGLGTQEPLSSWGALLSDGANSMEVSPWLLLFPADSW